MRYLPPVFHHPVWFWGEWDDNKVHSWDPVDSIKYVDFDEFMDAALGRIYNSIDTILSRLSIKVQAAENAVMTREESSDGLLVRKTIYQYYIKELNLSGHNIYLQYGTDFGIIVMILFFILITWTAFFGACRIHKKCREEEVGYLLFALIPALFGMVEYSWGVGSITILMLFVAWREVVCNEKE